MQYYTLPTTAMLPFTHIIVNNEAGAHIKPMQCSVLYFKREFYDTNSQQWDVKGNEAITGTLFTLVAPQLNNSPKNILSLATLIWDFSKTKQSKKLHNFYKGVCHWTYLLRLEELTKIKESLFLLNGPPTYF